VLNNKVLFTPSVFTTDDFDIAVHEKGAAEMGGTLKVVVQIVRSRSEKASNRFNLRTFPENRKMKSPAEADRAPRRVCRNVKRWRNAPWRSALVAKSC
jgi:hypothetical protein